ncbi:MAG: type II secretion system F family protein [Clostridiales bacterium]|nr:type II secretion system F family protein [Clostridiales bacterium]
MRNLKYILHSHRKSILILGLFILLAAGVYIRDRTDAEGNAGFVERDAEGGDTQNRTFSFRLEKSAGQGDEASESGELELSVSPVQSDPEEAFALLDQAVLEWEAGYLGENESANEVRYDLSLPSQVCDGRVQVSCESSDSGILQADGAIFSDGLGEEGALVDLTVKFIYGDYTRMETYAVRVFPPEEGSREWILSELTKAAEQAEEESRDQSGFVLPDSVAGYRVIWEEENQYQWILFLLLGIVAAFCLEQQEKQADKQRQKKRREQLEWEYPLMVDQFSVLLESGMTIRAAWERILKRERYAAVKSGGKNSKPDSVYLEEMGITWREIREGRGEGEAYERFGRRIGLMSYKRFSSILSQNLSKGTRDVRELLRKESLEAMEIRKNRARRLGEEAGAKLLFPMLVMLMLILLVLLLPALTSL